MEERSKEERKVLYGKSHRFHPVIPFTVDSAPWRPLFLTPLSNEVFGLGRVVFGQGWRLAVDDGLKLGERGGEDLRRVGVLPDGELDDGESEGPDV
jgi:hypothetical protein